MITSTFHYAKGRDWRVVHILHAADGMIPSDTALGDSAGEDEERRLLYVAMTPAKDNLYVYFPLRYYHRRFALGDGHSYAQLTRFIPDTVRTLFEERTESVEVPCDEMDWPAKGPSDVRRMKAKLKQLWQSEEN